MRICDKCGAIASCKITFSDDNQQFDICQTHKEEIIEILQAATEASELMDKPRRGRSPKLNK